MFCMRLTNQNKDQFLNSTRNQANIQKVQLCHHQCPCCVQQSNFFVCNPSFLKVYNLWTRPTQRTIADFQYSCLRVVWTYAIPILPSKALQIFQLDVFNSVCKIEYLNVTHINKDLTSLRTSFKRHNPPMCLPWSVLFHFRCSNQKKAY